MYSKVIFSYTFKIRNEWVIGWFILKITVFNFIQKTKPSDYVYFIQMLGSTGLTVAHFVNQILQYIGVGLRPYFSRIA